MNLKKFLFGPAYSHVFALSMVLLFTICGFLAGHHQGMSDGISFLEEVAVENDVAWRAWTPERGWHVKWVDRMKELTEAYLEGVKDASRSLLNDLRSNGILQEVPKKPVDPSDPDRVPPPGWVPGPAPAPERVPAPAGTNSAPIRVKAAPSPPDFALRVLPGPPFDD